MSSATIRCMFASCIIFTFSVVVPQIVNSQEGEFLTTQEITELLSGNSFKGEALDSFTIYFSPDFKTIGREGGSSDTGTWKAENDEMCVIWKKWVKGNELCWKLRRDGNKIYREASKNSHDNVVIWYEGNVDGL
jgi:hypothetical protein